MHQVGIVFPSYIYHSNTYVFDKSIFSRLILCMYSFIYIVVVVVCVCVYAFSFSFLSFVKLNIVRTDTPHTHTHHFSINIIAFCSWSFQKKRLCARYTLIISDNISDGKTIYFLPAVNRSSSLWISYETICRFFAMMYGILLVSFLFLSQCIAHSLFNWYSVFLCDGKLF